MGEAGIGLLVTHSVWLRRPEFRCAIEVWQDGRDAAGIDWEQVDFEASASSSEAAVLALVGSLFGQLLNRPLSWLLSNLDERNSALVAEAVRHACSGPGKGLVR